MYPSPFFARLLQWGRIQRSRGYEVVEENRIHFFNMRTHPTVVMFLPGAFHSASKAWLFTTASDVIKGKKMTRKPIHHMVATAVIAVDNYHCSTSPSPTSSWWILQAQSKQSISMPKGKEVCLVPSTAVALQSKRGWLTATLSYHHFSRSLCCTASNPGWNNLQLYRQKQ